MSNTSHWDRVIRLLLERGYITSDDLPSDDAEKTLDELRRLGWLREKNGRFELGELGRLHLDVQEKRLGD